MAKDSGGRATLKGCYVTLMVVVIGTSYAVYNLRHQYMTSQVPMKVPAADPNITTNGRVPNDVTTRAPNKTGCDTCGKSRTTTPPDISRNKLILFYNPLHWWNDWLREKGSDVFRDCSVKHCTITKNVNKFNVSDAVFFNMHTIPKVPVKQKRQVWIFSEFEAPDNFADTDILNRFRGMINWTFTYRRDSDFHIPHGRFVKRSEVKNENLNLELSHKTRNRVAVAFISHCPTRSRRLQFVQQMKQSGIHVDIYGQCGNLHCYGQNRHKTSWNITQNHDNKCFSSIVPTYKFYMSAENALCRDYVTEKSLNLVLQYYIVPVIRDGANRSLYHPPGSAIDTKKFHSSIHLGVYLSSLNSNMAAYRDFFTWRKYFYTEGILNSWNNGMCELCRRLHHADEYRRVYDDVASWFVTPGGKRACYKPKDLLYANV